MTAELPPRRLGLKSAAATVKRVCGGGRASARAGENLGECLSGVPMGDGHAHANQSCSGPQIKGPFASFQLIVLLQSLLI